MTEANVKKPATIQDVARCANVSVATVSRTLSAPDSVSETRRDAVLRAIESTGYRVNRAAQSLRTQRSNTVLVLLPSLANPFFSHVLKGIADGLSASKQALLVAETGQMFSAGDDLLTYLEDQRADGAIVLDGALPTASLQRLKQSRLASNVVFACEWPARGGVPSVRSANEHGAVLAVRHLHALGHRNIVHVTGPIGNVLTDTRSEGYRLACNELGLRATFFQGDFSLQGGVEAAAQIVKLEPRPTAVFCASDVTAFGLISGLTRFGISVPNDVSVVGFDDIEYSEHFVPPLTTVRQDRVTLGKAAARLLLENSKGQVLGLEERVQEVPVELVLRKSTAPLGA